MPRARPEPPTKKTAKKTETRRASGASRAIPAAPTKATTPAKAPAKTTKLPARPAAKAPTKTPAKTTKTPARPAAKAPAKPPVGAPRRPAAKAKKDPAVRPALEIYQGDNLEVLRGIRGASFDLIYIDPPFNTGKKQSRRQLKTERDERGDRKGFKGQRYRTTVLGERSYDDSFDDYMAFLLPRLREARRLLKPSGSLFVHLDYREVHYAKVALDQLFGRESFINEIIWAYDYGARATRRWSPKHDSILWYARTPDDYCFNYDAIDRIPYMAPGLVGPEKAARGKTPTDTWWHTIVSPNGKEKTGYPTQKPLKILERIVRVHSNPGDHLLDFFAGSGTLGEAAARHGRRATLIDKNPEAIAVMRKRLAPFGPRFLAPGPPQRSQKGARARARP